MPAGGPGASGPGGGIRRLRRSAEAVFRLGEAEFGRSFRRNCRAYPAGRGRAVHCVGNGRVLERGVMILPPVSAAPAAGRFLGREPGPMRTPPQCGQGIGWRRRPFHRRPRSGQAAPLVPRPQLEGRRAEAVEDAVQFQTDSVAHLAARRPGPSERMERRHYRLPEPAVAADADGIERDRAELLRRAVQLRVGNLAGRERGRGGELWRIPGRRQIELQMLCQRRQRLRRRRLAVGARGCCAIRSARTARGPGRDGSSLQRAVRLRASRGWANRIAGDRPACRLHSGSRSPI